MPMFRKKPVVIEAIKWDGGNLAEVLAFTGKHPKWDEWFSDFDHYERFVFGDGFLFKIFTLEGTMSAVPGDWIIRGVKGEHYPCKPDIFAATYAPLTPTTGANPLENTEAKIESEIQAKGLTAPRLTPAAIDGVIVSEQYYVAPGTTLTSCILTLRNGFLVTGESAAASPENFDAEIGRKIARQNARDKIWALEGYLLKQRLYEAAAVAGVSQLPSALRAALAELADVVRVVATDVALPPTERARLDTALAMADHLTGAL